MPWTRTIFRHPAPGNGNRLISFSAADDVMRDAGLEGVFNRERLRRRGAATHENISRSYVSEVTAFQPV